MMFAQVQIDGELLQILSHRKAFQRTGNQRPATCDLTAFPVKAILAFLWGMALRGLPFWL